MPRWAAERRQFIPDVRLRVAFDADDNMLVWAPRQDTVGVDAACHHVSCAGRSMT
jgi:hypothetical protein